MADLLIPKWKDGNGSQFMKNLDRYLRYEVDLEEHESVMREKMAMKENHNMGVAKMDGLGQLKASIPARDYFRWHQAERGCWGDKGFIKGYLNKNPNLKAQTMSKQSFSGPSVKVA